MSDTDPLLSAPAEVRKLAKAYQLGELLLTVDPDFLPDRRAWEYERGTIKLRLYPESGIEARRKEYADALELRRWIRERTLKPEELKPVEDF